MTTESTESLEGARLIALIMLVSIALGAVVVVLGADHMLETLAPSAAAPAVAPPPPAP